MDMREARPETDFARIVEMVNAVQQSGLTVGQLRAWHDNVPPGRICRRIVAVDAGDRAVGYAVAAHETWAKPGDFYVWVTVAPDWRRQGAGARLYAEALAYVRSHGATRLTSEVRDNCPVSLGFAQRRDFEVDWHSYQSVLDLTTFDESPYVSMIEGLQASGIRFTSLAEMGDTTPARRRLHNLNSVVIADIPGADGPWMPYEEFVRIICGADWFRPDGQLVALDGDKWIGMAAVQLIPEQRLAQNLMTGVVQAYRRRKIGVALKVLAARYAMEKGALSIRTDNDSNNEPMLALNCKIGYRPLPGKYGLKLEVTALTPPPSPPS